jgi:hypothetical protein
VLAVAVLGFTPAVAMSLTATDWGATDLAEHVSVGWGGDDDAHGWFLLFFVTGGLL